MQITIHRDVDMYVLTTNFTKEDLDLVKKYRPDALKIKDADGNDVFGLSYVPGKSCIAKNGVTFGAVNEDKFLIAVGSIPEGTTNKGEYVADVVGAAVAHLTLLEEQLPAVITGIREERAALISGIVNA